MLSSVNSSAENDRGRGKTTTSNWTVLSEKKQYQTHADTCMHTPTPTHPHTHTKKKKRKENKTNKKKHKKPIDISVL